MNSVMKITENISLDVTIEDLDKIEKAIEVYKTEIGKVLLDEGMTLRVFASLQFLNRTEKEYWDLQKNLLTRTVVVVPITSMVGMIAGYGTGAFIAYQIGVSYLGPAGAILGMIGGSTFGIILSIASSIREFNQEIKKDADLYKSQVIDKVFVDYIAEDEVLSQYICPISQEVIIVPTSAPDGQVYDFPHIVNWLDTKPEGALASPLRICDFEMIDLKIDLDALEMIGKRVQHLYYTHIKSLQNNNVIKKNFTCFAQKRNEVYKEIVNTYNMVLMNLRSTHHIEKEEYDEETEKMYKLYEIIKIVKI